MLTIVLCFNVYPSFSIVCSISLKLSMEVFTTKKIRKLAEKQAKSYYSMIDKPNLSQLAKSEDKQAKVQPNNGTKFTVQINDQVCKPYLLAYLAISPVNDNKGRIYDSKQVRKDTCMGNTKLLQQNQCKQQYGWSYQQPVNTSQSVKGMVVSSQPNKVTQSEKRSLGIKVVKGQQEIIEPILTYHISDYGKTNSSFKTGNQNYS